jgi:hypothetical protein
MTNSGETYRKPETEFEFWVDRVAAGIQCVRNGVFNTYYIELDSQTGLMVDSSNVDHEIGRIMCLAKDLGIEVVSYPQDYSAQHDLGRKPVDFTDFQTEMTEFRESEM